jgi:hypothetical protein
MTLRRRMGNNTTHTPFHSAQHGTCSSSFSAFHWNLKTKIIILNKKKNKFLFGRFCF